jgi:hypothetical protein
MVTLDSGLCNVLTRYQMETLLNVSVAFTKYLGLYKNSFVAAAHFINASPSPVAV